MSMEMARTHSRQTAPTSGIWSSTLRPESSETSPKLSSTSSLYRMSTLIGGAPPLNVRRCNPSAVSRSVPLSDRRWPRVPPPRLSPPPVVAATAAAAVPAAVSPPAPPVVAMLSATFSPPRT